MCIRDSLQGMLLEDGYISSDMRDNRADFMARLGVDKDSSAAERVVEALTDTEDTLIFESPFLELLMPQRFSSEVLSIVKPAKFFG